MQDIFSEYIFFSLSLIFIFYKLFLCFSRFSEWISNFMQYIILPSLYKKIFFECGDFKLNTDGHLNEYWAQSTPDSVKIIVVSVVSIRKFTGQRYTVIAILLIYEARITQDPVIVIALLTVYGYELPSVPFLCILPGNPLSQPPTLN